MAKSPAPGVVKTRLTSRLSALEAAHVAQAMGTCMAARLRQHFARVVLAGDPAHSIDTLAEEFGATFDDIIPQGEGSLGDRMGRIWSSIDAPVAFFGIDSPDIPAAALRAISSAVERADVAIGPTEDGGYWTIAGRTCPEVLFAEVQWGTSTVFDMTVRIAAQAGWSVHVLPAWYDVDEPNDLERLIGRLSAARPDPHLAVLRESVERVYGGQHTT